MVRSQTNNAVFSVAREATQGNLPGSPSWTVLEVNSPEDLGASITTTSRSPISRTRGRRAPVVTDLDSLWSAQTDLTIETLEQFAEGFVGNVFENLDFELRDGVDTVPPPAVASSDSFTVDPVTSALAAKITFSASGARTLLYAQGYSNADNNGIHEIDATVSAAAETIGVTSSLVDETPPTNAICRVAGVRVSSGDLTLTISSGVGTLTSAADVSDWAARGLQVGMHIYISSADTDGTPTNGLGTGTDKYGRARVRAIASNVLTLDKLDATLTADAGGSSDVDVMFGLWARNVPTDANGTTEGTYLERYYQFESTLSDLGGVGTDEYLYSLGNASDAISINAPLTDIGGLEIGFIGTDTENPTTVRKTNAASAKEPLRVEAFSTASQFASLTTDLTSTADNTCFKSWTVTIGNNVSPEKCLGNLGSRFTNFGDFLVDLESQMILTEGAQISGVRNNTTYTFTSMLVNSDGGFVLDLPSIKYTGSDLEFPENESILINLPAEAFNDPNNTVLPDVSVSMTFFSGIPYILS